MVVVVVVVVASHPSNMLVYLRGRSCSDKRTRCHTEVEVEDRKLFFFISPSRSILTPGLPVPALTLYHQAPGRVATEAPVVRLLV